MRHSDGPDPVRVEAERILESITEAFFGLDSSWRFTYLNSQAERLFGRSRAEMRGRNIWEELPAAVGTAFFREYHRAVEEQTPVSFEEYYPPPLDTWFEVRAYPSSDGLSVYLNNITERKRAEEALRRSEARYRSLVDPTTQIVWTNSPEGEMLEENTAWGVFTGQSEGEYRGYGWAAAVHPDDAQPTVDAWRQSVDTRTPFMFEHRLRRHDGVYRTFGVRAFPVLDPDGRLREWVGIHTDVTERRENQSARDAALAQLEAVLDSATDGIIVSDPAGNLVMWNPAGLAMHEFGSLDEARQHLSELKTLFTFSDATGHLTPFDEWPLSRLMRGETFTDYELCLRRLDTGREMWASYGGSIARAPDGTALLLVLTVRDVSERKETGARLEASYRREALLNRIGQAVRRAAGPEEIEQAALAGLAEALGVDRCLSITVDAAADRVRFTAEWRRPDLPPLVGDYPIEGFGGEIGRSFPAGQALVVPDIREAPWSAEVSAVLAGMRIRALMDIPFLGGDKVVGALGVYMADVPRAWTDEEVVLVEAVASQLRAALEAARVRARERRIATELQEALQPPIPEHVLGLRIASFLRPALDEAAIGGDFYDVFALDKGLYALVIGDVSGKGLAAAAQLALVRNSLRTVLYLYRDPAQAVVSLNALLTAHDLLLGFVTAFVGIYDAGAGEIKYVSCGHEPPLIRRAATGAVEALEPTGLPLGVSQNAAYGEASVSLGDGDRLLLYTDGLSEAGPSRLEMLGPAGLTQILVGLTPDGVHEAVAKLVADVSDYARGVFRDDVCVLMIERR